MSTEFPLAVLNQILTVSMAIIGVGATLYPLSSAKQKAVCLILLILICVGLLVVSGVQSSRAAKTQSAMQKQIHEDQLANQGLRAICKVVWMR